MPRISDNSLSNEPSSLNCKAAIAFTTSAFFLKSMLATSTVEAPSFKLTRPIHEGAVFDPIDVAAHLL
jgi:hypothetical protein